MKIYTKHGDSSETSIIGGKRVAKDDVRIEAVGQIDELSSVLGIIIAFSDNEQPKEVKEILMQMQRNLFVIGTDLATPLGEKIAIPRFSPSKINEIEQMIDEIDSELPKIRRFLLPGGSKTASLVHFARAICRKAERRVITLNKHEKVNEAIPIYLNRLGDLLFVLARSINYKKKISEIVWR